MSEEMFQKGREGFLADNAKWREALQKKLNLSSEVEWNPTEAGREFLETHCLPIVGREAKLEMNGRVYMVKVTGFDNETFTLSVEFEGDTV